MSDRKGISLHARVAPGTIGALKAIALKLGMTYNNEGSISKLLDAIAAGEIILIQRKF